ncbi:hypothetical protein IFM89_038571 [Coptis chinensis]|uniref:Uncharacterized protein n=1 Tax=Coptis chinensis TaxID=261450 RepID=A0A835HJI3_9MAGN|nr:hypothetical protein IFM89_038571 [Coptis chinensis]
MCGRNCIQAKRPHGKQRVSYAMETEETIPEETMVKKADEDKEFVAGPKRRIGDKKPVATAKTTKPAATRRNRGQTRLKPKLITDVLKPQRANYRAGKYVLSESEFEDTLRMILSMMS